MDADPAELDEIRELWKEHSKAEDNRSIEGLLATLSEDCVYTVYPDDVSWHGHEGAARFYTELLTAFPDIVFELQNIVIGPQGVVEEAIVTGAQAKWLDNEPTGETMTWRNAIFFPWDPVSRASRASGSTPTCRGGPRMTYAFSSLDELGDGPASARSAGARVTAFGVNGVVYPPGYPGSATTTTRRTSSTSSTAARRRSRSRARRILGPGGLFHVESTTRRIANVGDEELVMLVIGGKDGYVERDGHVMSDEDLERRIPRKGAVVKGLMMDFQLTLPTILKRAETYFPHQEIVTRMPDRASTATRSPTSAGGRGSSRWR